MAAVFEPEVRLCCVVVVVLSLLCAVSSSVHLHDAAPLRPNCCQSASLQERSCCVAVVVVLLPVCTSVSLHEMLLPCCQHQPALPQTACQPAAPKVRSCCVVVVVLSLLCSVSTCIPVSARCCFLLLPPCPAHTVCATTFAPSAPFATVRPHSYFPHHSTPLLSCP